jgi:hypothetical protein
MIRLNDKLHITPEQLKELREKAKTSFVVYDILKRLEAQYAGNILGH